MYKDDLALNNLHWLICHKTKPNQTLGNCFKSTDYDWCHCDLYFLSRSWYFSCFSPFSAFTPRSAGREKRIKGKIFFLLIINTKYVLLVGIVWSVYISKYHIILLFWFSRTDSGLRIYHLVVWSNFNLLHNSQFSYPVVPSLILILR